MSNKSSHPDEELFNFLSGSLDAQAARLVEDHLSKCDACGLVARFIRSLKIEAGTLLTDGGSIELPDAQSQTSNLKSEIAKAHPDTSELASFFYAKSRPRRDVAAHVAICRRCAEDIAEYARAERLADAHYTNLDAAVELPRAAWDMIGDWEGSFFATPKPTSEAIGPQMLDKLSRLVGEQDTEFREMARNVSSVSQPETGELVPVIVVNRNGELRGIEMFEKTSGPRGTNILKHRDESGRFHDKPVHALLDFGEGNRVVVSELIHKDTVRLEPARARKKILRADYFIIED